MRHPQRSIFNFAGFFTEDSPQQFFFCGKFGFTFGLILPTRISSGIYFGSDADDTVFIQFTQAFFTDIRDITGNFFRSQFGIPGFYFMFFDMDRSKFIIFLPAGC